jgi:hypothetical protein
MACVFPVMTKEQDEIAAIQAVLNGSSTDIVKNLGCGLMKEFQDEVFNTWSDHEPIFTHLPCQETGEH